MRSHGYKSLIARAGDVLALSQGTSLWSWIVYVDLRNSLPLLLTQRSLSFLHLLLQAKHEREIITYDSSNTRRLLNEPNSYSQMFWGLVSPLS